MKEREARAHMSEGTSGAGLSNRGAEGESREGDGKALVTYNRAPSIRGNDQDFIRRSEIDALIKMLKDNDNIHGYSFGASMIARTLEISSNVADIARINETRIARDARTRYDFASTAKTDHKFNAYRSPSILYHNASNMSKPLIVDSCESHHMISDTNLIKDRTN